MILLAMGLFISIALSAQQTYRIGSLPQFNYNLSLASDWQLNGKVETRQLWRTGSFGQGDAQGLKYALTDLSVQAAYKSVDGNTFSAGYLWRVQPDQDAHRFMQQYSVVRRYARFRLGQRFAADQTLAFGEAAVYRLRYRLGLDLPLNGERVDPGEWYFKLTHEYLNILENSQYDLEIRLSPTFGHAFNDLNKLEVGLEYRIDRLLITNPVRHSLFLRLSWYLKKP